MDREEIAHKVRAMVADVMDRARQLAEKIDADTIRTVGLHGDDGELADVLLYTSDPDLICRVYDLPELHHKATERIQ
jgi:predicted regulator of Ras-like GTPase activity (Roadblock/LC7/MglB family)